MRRLYKGYVEELLSYDKETGEFTWLVSRGSIKPGRKAGTKSIGRERPYYMIKIDKKFYYSHKLAWLLEYDEWPQALDHINGNSLDNRIKNLRKCNMSQNKANSVRYKNNKVGAKGIHRDKQGKKYCVTIQHNKKQMWLGTYETLQEAKSVYAKTAKKLFGEFARTD